MGIDEILALAKAPRTIERPEFDLVEPEELGKLYRSIREEIHQEFEVRPKARPLSNDDRRRISEDISDCISCILTSLPPKSDRVNFNKLVMNLILYFQTAGWSKSDVWAKVEPFLQNYPHSETYPTYEKRLEHWRQQWAYLDGNDSYTFNCSFILGFSLPGSAFECKDCIGVDEQQRDEQEPEYIYPLEPQYDYLDHIEADFPERPHFMDLFVPQQAYILFAAVSKLGKTILATDIAHCVAFGIPFLSEFKVHEPVRTLILQSDINDSYPQQRVRANFEYLCKNGYVETIEDHRRNLIIHPLTSVHDPEDPKFDKWLRAFIKHNSIRFVLIDPLQDFTIRADSDNAEMNLVTRHVRTLIKGLDISVMVVPILYADCLADR